MSLNMVGTCFALATAVAFFPCASALEAAMKHAQMKQVSFAEPLQAGAALKQGSVCLDSNDLTWTSVPTDLVVEREEPERNMSDVAPSVTLESADGVEVKAPALEATAEKSPPALAKPINLLTMLVVLDMLRRWLACEQEEEDEEEDEVAGEMQSGWELFAKAVALNDIDECEALLKAGTNMSERDPWGSTLLHLAASEGCVRAVAMLLERGAEVDASDASDETPLHAAARSGSGASCELLLDHGATIDRSNKADQTPLLVGAHANQEDACSLLLRRGAAGEAGSLIGTSSAVSLAKQSSTQAEFAGRIAEAHSYGVIESQAEEDQALAPTGSIDSLKDLITRLRKLEEPSNTGVALE